MAGRRPRPPRPLLVVATLAVVAGACASSSEDGERSGTSTTIGEVVTSCPAGQDVPDAGGSRATEALPLEVQPEPATGPGLDVATLLPRTGDLAFLGAPTVAAAERAVGDLNEAGGVLGAPVVLRHADSAEGVAGAAAAEVDRVLAAGARVVVGPLSSSVAADVLDRVAGAGGVLVTPGAASEALDRLDGAGRLFRTVATERLQGRALAELVLADGLRTVDLVVRGDAYGEAVAGGFLDALVDGGGTVARRHDRPPVDGADDLGPLGTGEAAEATVLVGLVDTAPVLDALVAAGRGPREHPTYGTDGNLGERLGDLVARRSALACLRGLLAVSPPDGAFADAILDEIDEIDEIDDLDGTGAPEDGADLVLDHAAETYDAVVAAALAAEVAGAADGAAIAGALRDVTGSGTPCDAPAPCLELARSGADLVYLGRSGRLLLDEVGNRSTAVLTLAAFDEQGDLARLGAHAAP